MDCRQPRGRRSGIRRFVRRLSGDQLRAFADVEDPVARRPGRAHGPVGTCCIYRSWVVAERMRLCISSSLDHQQRGRWYRACSVCDRTLVGVDRSSRRDFGWTCADLRVAEWLPSRARHVAHRHRGLHVGGTFSDGGVVP